MSRRSSRLASANETKLEETSITSISKKRAAPELGHLPKQQQEILTSKTISVLSKKGASGKNTKKAKVITTATVATVAAGKAEAVQNQDGDGRVRCPWAASVTNQSIQAYHDNEWAIKGGIDRSNRFLFEMLILEGAQAGLSWNTILQKRDDYRAAYANFDYNHLADNFHSPAANDRLLQANIVKNRLKVEASLLNARLFRELLEELYPDQAKPEDQNGFWCYLQQFKIGAAKAAKAAATAATNGNVQDEDASQNRASKMKKQHLKNGKVDAVSMVTPAYDEEEAEQELTTFTTRSLESDRLSAALKKRGFKFVGTTICYTYLMAVGVTEDFGLAHFPKCFRHPSNE